MNSLFTRVPAYLSILAAAAVSVHAGEPSADSPSRLWSDGLGPGVEYTFENRPEVPLAIYTLTVDTSREDIVMEPYLTDGTFDTRRPVHRVVERAYEPEARPFGAINADYGSVRNRPHGPFVGQGTTWLHPTTIERSSVCVDEHGNIFLGAPRFEAHLRGPEGTTPIELDVVNVQFRAEDWDLPPANTLFTWPLGPEAPEPPEGFLSFPVELDGEELLPNAPASGTVTASPGTEALPLDKKRIAIRLEEPLPEWIDEGATITVDIAVPELPGKVVGMVGGGPLILKDGEILGPERARVEGEFMERFYPQRHPRTAIGLKEDGKTVIAMVVDGRRDHSRGVTLDELAELMKEKGAVTAMNLDGGGSSTMVVQGEIVNIVAGSRPRALATSILFRRLGPLEPQTSTE